MKAILENELLGLVNPSQVPFIVSVSAFETGGFRSPVLIHNRNLFGMKLPTKRPTTATGQARGHATYNSFQDSIKDFVLWQGYTGFPAYVFNLKSFIRNMKDRSYFEADFNKYFAGVATWYDKLYVFKDEQ